jgi:hypothetical protein
MIWSAEAAPLPWCGAAHLGMQERVPTNFFLLFSRRRQRKKEEEKSTPNSSTTNQHPLLHHYQEEETQNYNFPGNRVEAAAVKDSPQAQVVGHHHYQYHH